MLAASELELTTRNYSPAAAGAAAPSIAANVAALNATLASRYLFIEPYRCQVPIQIMTS
jgi:hypothetical protein